MILRTCEHIYLSDKYNPALLAIAFMVQVGHITGKAPRLPKTQGKYVGRDLYLASLEASIAKGERVIPPIAPYDLITSIMSAIGYPFEHMVYWGKIGEESSVLMKGAIAAIQSDTMVVWINRPAMQSMPQFPHAHIMSAKEISNRSEI